MRAILAPLTSTSEDVHTWWLAATQAYFGLHLYQHPGFSYPPLWGYLLELLGSVARWVSLPPTSLGVLVPSLTALHTQLGDVATGVTSPLFNLAFKAVLCLLDVLTGALVWRAAQLFGASPARARWAFSAWFLGPAVIFESAVHGSFDVFVAFFSVLALTARVERRFFLCGMALALGAGAKLAPVFLVPLFVASIALPFPEEPSTGRVRSLGLLALGGAAGAVAVLGPIAAVREVPQLLTTVLARSTGPPGSGGLSVFGAQYIPPFAGVSTWLLGAGDWYAAAIPWLYIGLAMSLAAGYWRWGRPHGREGLLSLACLAYLGVYVATPLIQPQYLVWVLPLLVVGASVISGWGMSAGLYLLQLAIVTFEVGILGVFAFLTPASYALRTPPLSFVLSRTLTFVTDPGILASSVSYDFLAAAWLLAIAGYGILLPRLIRSLALRGGGLSGPIRPAPATSGQGRPSVNGAQRSPLVSRLGWLTTAALIAIGAWTMSPAYAAGANRLSVDRVGLGSRYAIARVEESTSFGPTRIVGFSVTHRPRVAHIFMYSGTGYPDAGSSGASAQGVYNHLTADLGTRYSIAQLSATALPLFLRDHAAASTRALVVSSGTLPATVLSRTGQLVTPWIAAGGLFIWAGGAPPGYYIVHPGSSMFAQPASVPVAALCGFPTPSRRLASSVTVLGQAGVDSIVGHHNLLTGGSSCWSFSATDPTRPAAALGLPYSLIHVGPSLARLGSVGGAALGYLGAGSTSIATWPLGRGRFLLFTGETLASPVALSLARILLSGVLSAAGPLSSALVPPGPDRRLPLRVSTPHSARFLVVLAVGVPPEDPLLLRTLVPLRGARAK